jgi:hypothetical protein
MWATFIIFKKLHDVNNRKRGKNDQSGHPVVGPRFIDQCNKNFTLGFITNKSHLYRGQGSVVWSQFSAIFANFRRKKLAFPSKSML